MGKSQANVTDVPSDSNTMRWAPGARLSSPSDLSNPTFIPEKIFKDGTEEKACSLAIN